MSEYKTRSELRIAELINCGRPLTDEESDDLYRALHADYMRQWRLARAQTEAKRRDLELSKLERGDLLFRLRREARA